ncbi:cellulose biosynthesis regulator diguanylate cyclase DgcQ [Phytobacter diazotrophicus]|uniref:cellulose biosynthesis regulator diguanylate cyclase DgcQ n=1 Tax=Phytobacter diazotrophicus TaxID=395631 RepID=UPI0013ED17F5|nr:cellulose biosynthesis regulator diguanylate cyclase DgcQ [Phytobacter diazotrophicus]MDU7131673.1 cellulose biosynthesis regulator diguanylate cyclase DgcQ [Enterobacteriaceae bacterium]QIH62863.1 cellulose biosynthesis regulator YedQ [Enterobacteriaceae bacterium A-F18]
MGQEKVVKSPPRLAFVKTWFVPSRVVNLCFVIVLVCSTVLTWREVIVMKGAYVVSQRNALDNVTNVLDRQMQVGIDRLLFFRNGMQSAVQTPLAFDVLRNIQAEFEKERILPYWQIGLDNRRTLPLYGVSDYFVDQSALLSRDNPLLHNELTAAMELGYLFRFSSSASMFPRRALYVSRAGFFISTLPVGNNNEIVQQYYQHLTSPWFSGQSERENKLRGVRWFSDEAHTPNIADSLVTASVPLDFQNYWYGVLSMSFPVSSMKALLTEARQSQDKGEYQLYDAQFTLLTTTADAGTTSQQFSPDEHAQLQREMARDTAGGLRLGTRFVSWVKLKHFEGSVLRIQTLHEGLRGDFGSISIALALLWLLFTTMLLLSWGVIRRMVSNMFQLQHTLQWQAWYDPLTRLNNRGALFERAQVLTTECAAQNLPLSVIQIDLDHFKRVNDRFGHQAGDLVLSYAAGLIGKSIREQDVAGRVGGEEFCVLLPGATLADATAVAEKIRQRISSKEIFVQKSKTIRVTASLGVSSALESGNYDFEYLQSVADSRLYHAKNNGRNQVCAEDGVTPLPNT